ncbi:probable pleckstrin homology domain-containing family N member 1 [Oncorhynchus clarkii lewisi]|uniref:probable pleckstrin homology domain-containing family N member 1 n=1 Tax=Oncorhynchus clarkii lewisi TaxID=490388 RepID=UPI0039B8D252
MGCCSVTQRGAHSGIDEVGPDEIELLEIDNSGIWTLGESRLQLSVRNGKDGPTSRYPSVRHLDQEIVLWGRSREELYHSIYNQPIRDWEGQPAHMYGEIVHSSRVSLHNSYTQETSEHYLVLFSFHLLILYLDPSRQDFIYEGILPLSGLSFQATSLDSNKQHIFQISGPMVDSKVFTCASAAELNKWIHHMEERRYKSISQPLSPSSCALSYLVPCDESWKKEELKKYLLQAPIRHWEGVPIQHMGQPGYISMVHIFNTQRQGLHERLLVLFPQDVLLLSVDNERLSVKYEGKLSRKSIAAVERSALPGRMEFELTGELMEPLQVSCTCPEDYQNWIFQLQQLEKNLQATSNHTAPPLMLKKMWSRKESREPMTVAQD